MLNSHRYWSNTHRILQQYPYLHHSYWSSIDTSSSTSSKVIASEVESLPISGTALGVESSFFRWFGHFIVNEARTIVEKNQGTNAVTTVESLLCTAAEMFGDLKAVKYPCAVIAATGTHVTLSENYQGSNQQQQQIQAERQQVKGVGGGRANKL